MKAQSPEPIISYFPAPVSNQHLAVSPLTVAYVLVGLLVGAVVGFRVFQPIKVLPRMQLAPTFTLIDQTGAELNSGSLRGQFVLYTFTYAHCGQACEAQWQTLQEVQTRLAEANLGAVAFTPVIISMDAGQASPAALNQWAASFGPSAKTWRFVSTSDAAQLKSIIGEGFGVYYAPTSAGTFEYDPVFVLVDGLGVVRAEYRYRTEAPDANRLIRHLSMLGEEVRNSTGLTKYAYEAAHYFLCYAP
jgi:protein SCO1/2